MSLALTTSLFFFKNNYHSYMPPVSCLAGVPILGDCILGFSFGEACYWTGGSTPDLYIDNTDDYFGILDPEYCKRPDTWASCILDIL